MSRLLGLGLDADNWLIAQNKETRQLLSNPVLQKDTWRTIEDLSLKINEHKRNLTINFQAIEQDWLKLLVKLYVLVKSQRNFAITYLITSVSNLKKFSRFIKQKSIENPEQINNQLFEEFEHYLRSSELSTRTIIGLYQTLNSFFDLCNQEGWVQINTYWFKGRYKRPPLKNDEIEYIPEEVWQQINEHLHHLPEPLQRIVVAIRGTGLRIGEILTLPFDCLRQRGQQWRLRFLTEKYHKKDEIPICAELVAVIQEQQDYIRHHLGDSYDKLFGSSDGRGRLKIYKPVPRVMSAQTFNNYLNKLAQEYNICASDGQVWWFRSHQFRKTFATVMTNAGVRDLIIQKYLRHRSLDMQDHYKHILKQVLGDEYRQLMKETKYVDNTGKLVADHKPSNPITELLRRRMHQITTQYGECHRPVLKSPCQTVNACLRCEHWRTSTDDLNALKDDAQRIKTELEIAINLEMVRQQKGLASDHHSLMVRIQGLEKVNDKD